jgi:hypothetical protein
MHRFVWDLHYTGVPGGNPQSRRFGGGAGPWAPPGQYQVRLTASGQSQTQSLTVKMDPRVKTPQADLVKQFEMARQIGAAQAQVGAAVLAANRLHGQLQRLVSRAGEGTLLAGQIAALDRKTVALAGAAPTGSPSEGAGPPAPEPGTLRYLSSALGDVGRAVQSADLAPTADAVAAFRRDQQALEKALAQWNEIKTQDLPKLNASLKQANLQPVSLEERNREGR